jgi:hypothetical protein
MKAFYIDGESVEVGSLEAGGGASEGAINNLEDGERGWFGGERGGVS